MARITSSLGTYDVLVGDYLKGEQLLKEAIAILEKEQGESNEISLASSLNNLGNLYSFTGLYNEAIEQISRSIELCKKHYKPNHGLLAALKSNLASQYTKSGNHKLAETMHKDALMLHQQANDSTEIGRTEHNLALLYQNMVRQKEERSRMFATCVAF